MSVHAPAVGELDFLVYGECACGWRCACPEGWQWPRCPTCGEQVLPPAPSERREHGLGYAARLVRELDAQREAEAAGYRRGVPPRTRRYTREQVERWTAERRGERREEQR